MTVKGFSKKSERLIEASGKSGRFFSHTNWTGSFIPVAPGKSAPDANENVEEYLSLRLHRHLVYGAMWPS